MKKVNKKLQSYEQVLKAHNISHPVKNGKALLRLFSERTNSTIQIGELIETTKILIALKKQITIQKNHYPAGTKAAGRSG